MLRYMYTAWNDYKLINTSTHVFTLLCMWWEHLKFTVLANFWYTIQYYELQSVRFTLDLQNLLIPRDWNFIPLHQHLPISTTHSPWQPPVYFMLLWVPLFWTLYKDCSGCNVENGLLGGKCEKPQDKLERLLLGPGEMWSGFSWH